MPGRRHRSSPGPRAALLAMRATIVANSSCGETATYDCCARTFPTFCAALIGTTETAHLGLKKRFPKGQNPTLLREIAALRGHQRSQAPPANAWAQLD